MDVSQIFTTKGTDHKSLWWWCPGCDCQHRVPVEGSGIPKRWEWNQSTEKPTLKPSVLSYWHDENGNRITMCHCHVTNGRIQFLSDCPHKLAGQTVDMVEFKR